MPCCPICTEVCPVPSGQTSPPQPGYQNSGELYLDPRIDWNVTFYLFGLIVVTATHISQTPVCLTLVCCKANKALHYRLYYEGKFELWGQADRTGITATNSVQTLHCLAWGSWKYNIILAAPCRTNLTLGRVFYCSLCVPQCTVKSLAQPKYSTNLNINIYKLPNIV